MVPHISQNRIGEGQGCCEMILLCLRLIGENLAVPEKSTIELKVIEEKVYQRENKIESLRTFLCVLLVLFAKRVKRTGHFQDLL